MGSDAVHAAAGGLLLSLASAVAGYCWQVRADVALAGCALAAAAGAGLLWRAVRRLRASAAMPLEVPVGLPRDVARLSEHALQLEAQLEHAPVALFRAPPGADAGCLNAGARRLMAPGRVSDAAALRELLAAMPAGQRRVIEYETEAGRERALAAANMITVEGGVQRLIALLPMENELEAEAMRAWQQLVQVLTHEIMNSLTPVASLAKTSRDMLREAALPDDLRTDLDTALDAIGRRAGSLSHFAGGYRTLASVPEARPQRIVVSGMFARLGALFAAASFSVEPESIELMADAGQIEQALVNLLHNAVEATAGQPAPVIAVAARLTRGGRLRIEVSDNGPGVPDHLAGSLFTPFFSTKAGGSGIGLAMARQLVHRNGGALRYARPVKSGARFFITF
ncbi:sensor histidine kinase [Massilia sp. SM-13]|uniref:sensor histidine kinase n=1 Tax=Pseudoduganella rhizocola TaxID=3382643 RepID=UPI0038B482BB